MYLLEVIPLTNIPLSAAQTYSYYANQHVDVGSIVVVPVRNRKVEAIVVSASDLQSQKMLLRKVSFSIKSILDIAVTQPTLTKEQIKLIYWMSEYYHISAGKIAKTVTPKYAKRFKMPDFKSIGFKKKNVKIGLTDKEKSHFKKVKFFENQKKGLQICHISGKSDFRAYLYIAEQITKQEKQLLFLVPEVFMVKEATREFGKYFNEDQIVELHAGLPKTIYWQNWHKVKANFAKIIIGTRSAIFTPFENLGAIFIKDAYNVNYKQWDMHPKYDARDLAKYIIGEKKIKLILEEEIPSVSSMYQIQQGKYKAIVFGCSAELVSASHKSTDKNESLKQVQGDKIQIVDMREELLKRNFSMFSEDLTADINQALQNKKKSFLYINRRGTASSVMCRDCGYIEKCPNCDVSLVYHTFANQLYCHHCGFGVSISAKCPQCSGARIKYLGAGSEKVENETKKLFPKAKIVRIDSDLIKNPKEQEKAYEFIKNNEVDIVIGTQMAIKTCLPKFGFSGVVTMDNMLNLPDFASSEKVLQMVYSIGRLSEKILIQTYNPENQIFQAIKSNKIEVFYNKELEYRKMFKYPPFSRVIKLICRGKNSDQCQERMEDFVEKVNTLKIAEKKLQLNGPFPAFLARKKGLYQWQIVLKLLSPDYRVRTSVFNFIPADWEVDVNPESLL